MAPDSCDDYDPDHPDADLSELIAEDTWYRSQLMRHIRHSDPRDPDYEPHPKTLLAAASEDGEPDDSDNS